MQSHIQDFILSLDHESRVRFYEMLAHSLTISTRSVWSQPDLSDEDKVEGMKQINEILHRIISKITTTRQESHEWKEQDIFTMLSSVPNNSANSRDEIAAVLKSTLDKFDYEHKTKRYPQLRRSI